MHFKTTTAALAIAGLATAQNITGNYTHGVAHIQMNNIDATFTFDAVQGGVNVTVNVASGLTTGFEVNQTAGFEYHIHVLPVGPNNNCTSTGGHLDPLNVGMTTPCDPKNLTSCQEGDLSGKHGNLMAVNNSTGAIPAFSYVDSQLAFDGPTAASIIGRSVVIHNNGTRVGCANLIVDGYSTANSTNGTSGTTSAPASKPTSGATKLIGSVALSGVVALMMLAL
ncbi:hypothetical protein BGZ49_009840 [Haplosporangium sp. Z 27]|nr:hypothetical protein BGZ49_009840 [Haplosporangium sp. Z 27]